MSGETPSWLFELAIPSVVDEGMAVIARILSQLEEHGWEAMEQFAVHLALEEAVVNGIRHGNKFDPNKQLHVRYHLNAEEFHVEIVDQGEGFDRSTVPDPTQEENLEKTTGRGLMMMELYMSEVCYNDKGNSVRMRRRKGDPINIPDDDDEPIFADD